MADAFAAFEAKWLQRLREGAKVAFQHGPVSQDQLVHHAIADAFVETHGLKPIGFNWELLDAGSDMQAPRAALSEISSAFANTISNSNREWLGMKVGEQIAHDFLALFDSLTRTVVSNRYDGLWNPISGAAVEWGFVGFDDKRIALLLIVQD
ncbi:MAG: hypothetical protein AAGK02_05780 [Pseudomonadota bacterium]